MSTQRRDKIAETLAEHMHGKHTYEGRSTEYRAMELRCKCGWSATVDPASLVTYSDVWREHVADVLAATIRDTA